MGLGNCKALAKYTSCCLKSSSRSLSSPGLLLAKTSRPAALRSTTHHSILASTTIFSAQRVLRGPIFAVTLLAIFRHNTRALTTSSSRSNQTSYFSVGPRDSMPLNMYATTMTSSALWSTARHTFLAGKPATVTRNTVASTVYSSNFPSRLASPSIRRARLLTVRYCRAALGYPALRQNAETWQRFEWVLSSKWST